MALLTRKLKASSLIEVMVALIIVMVCFGIAMIIYLNVSQSDRQLQRLKGKLILNEIAIKTKNENSYIDDKIEFESINVNKTINPYNGIPGISLLLLEAYDLNGNKIVERKELVIVK